jgi:hypothetical protein
MVLHLRAGKRSCALLFDGQRAEQSRGNIRKFNDAAPGHATGSLFATSDAVETAARSVLVASGYVVGSPFLMLGNIAQASSQREQ